METMSYTFPAKRAVQQRVHVGVVGSGDLEVLMEPSTTPTATVVVNTSVDGFHVVWQAVLERFFSHFDALVAIEINDFGASPGVVALRLEQAAEELAHG
jgi:malonate decarboxylase delta subunit